MQVYDLKQHHLKVAKRCGAQVYPSVIQCLDWVRRRRVWP